MTTTQKKITARDKLIESAFNLIMAQGYNSTSVDEICADAEVSKGSFYHFFKSKEALGLAVLETYYDIGMRKWMSGPYMDESDPMKKLTGFMRSTEEQSIQNWGQGCLLGTFVMDLTDTDSSILHEVRKNFEEILDKLAVFFEPAVRRKGPTARDLANNYLVALEGGIVMSKAFKDPERIRESLRQFRRQLEAGLD